MQICEILKLFWITELVLARYWKIQEKYGRNSREDATGYKPNTRWREEEQVRNLENIRSKEKEK